MNHDTQYLSVSQFFDAPLLTRLFFRGLPKFRGYWMVPLALSRVSPARWWLHHADVVLSDRKFRIPLDLRDAYQIDVFAKDKSELCVPAVMAALLRPGDFYMDVGANAGWYCRLMAEVVGSDGLVVGLEPSRRAFKFLCKLGYDNFLPLPFAATERNGEILRDTSSPLHQAASSKFKADNEKKVNYGSGEIFALGRSIDSLLKDFKRSPRVIKVDVEGAELLVLRGAVQTLREVEAVVVEVNLDAHCQQFGYRFAEIFEFLDLHGFENRYEVKNVDNSVRQLGAREYIPGDILFARRKLTL